VIIIVISAHVATSRHVLVRFGNTMKDTVLRHLHSLRIKPTNMKIYFSKLFIYKYHLYSTVHQTCPYLC